MGCQSLTQFHLNNRARIHMKMYTSINTYEFTDTYETMHVKTKSKFQFLDQICMYIQLNKPCPALHSCLIELKAVIVADLFF